MNWSRALHYFICLILFFSVLGGLGGDRVVLAIQESGNDSFLSSLNQEEPLPEEKLELVCKYPTFEGKSGDSFEFEVGLKWLGGKPRTFDLAITEVPPRWSAAIVAGYPEKTIFGIGLEPEMQWPEIIRVKFAPVVGELPEPGEYLTILEASSDNIKETIKLKAVVTAKYGLDLYTGTGRLNTEADAGEDNHFSILLANSGSAAIENITFSSSKPEGWSVTFTPDKVESLDTGLTQEVDVVINPPRKTIAGDYMVTLRAESKEFSPDPLQLRVTVLTPTIWGWVGVLIVLAVIAGVGVVFWRLGRR